MSKENIIELSVGEKGDAFARRTSTITNVDRQPAGLNFYELQWSTQAMGAVIVEQGKLRFGIANVISVTSTEDMAFREEGIAEIKINSAITNSQTISHDEARLKTFAYLQKINEAGWKTTVPRSVARLRGKEMNNYLLKMGEYTTLDINYVPTLSEWMRYKDLTTWAFYADHAYLTVQITREGTLTDPLRPGAYLLSTNLQNEEEHFRGYVDGLDRAHWRDVLPRQIAAVQQLRNKMEAALSLEGFTIDESYVDPPLPAPPKR
jgi:hypothetical protein